MPPTRNIDIVTSAAWLVAAAITIVGLRYAQAVLLPLSLAMLFAFMLSPAVSLLSRTGLPRAPAVVLLSLVASIVLFGLGWFSVKELASFSNVRPEYQRGVYEKFMMLREGIDERVRRFEERLNRLSALRHKEVKPLTGAPPAPPRPNDPGQAPPPAPPVNWTEFLSPYNVIQGVTWPLFTLLGFSTLIGALTFFLLLNAEDLRDRVLRVVGQSHFIATSKALDEAARKVSCYLLFQFGSNFFYALLFGALLSAFDIPNALLWAILLIFLRFIPYLGLQLALLPPLLLSLASAPDWTQPLVLLACAWSLDLLYSSFVEPLIVGRGSGLSAPAVIVAAVFWTWVWGPVGLILATPITACLTVLGRYVPQLEFVSIFFGEKPPLDPAEKMYNRLLALTDQQILQMIESDYGDWPLTEIYDSLLLPALILAQKDFDLKTLSADDFHTILFRVRSLAEESSWHGTAVVPTAGKPAHENAGAEQPRVVLVPAHSEADEIAGLMLLKLLQNERFSAELLSGHTSAAERVKLIEAETPHILVISALPFNTLFSVRQLLKEFSQKMPLIPVMVGIWHTPASQENDFSKVPAPKNLIHIAVSFRDALDTALKLFKASVDLTPHVN